jgi:quercetin dioxygenase-like cupin family protein
MSHVLFADLNTEVEIPADGTLSRVLSNEGQVRLVLFAFDRGQELTEHSSSLPAIVQVISGTLTVEAGGERHRLTPQSWLYLEPGESHSVFADEPARMLLTLIRST